MATLCSHCTDLTNFDRWQETESIDHYRTAGELIQSADSCSLCSAINSMWPMKGAQNAWRPDPEDEGVHAAFAIGFQLHFVGNWPQTGCSWICLGITIAEPSLGRRIQWYFTVTTREPSSPSRIPLWDGGESSWEDKCSAIKSWYEACALEHEECRPPQGQLPERLLDVGSEQSNPRLVGAAGGGIPISAYAALSHCWGKLHPMVATKANLDQLYSGVPIDAFPRTFRQAILLTRELGIQYIWIDSLCIVQDDPADWSREAERMKYVYARSAVTISAADGYNATYGCFVDPDATGYDPKASKSRSAQFLARPQGAQTLMPIRVDEGHVSELKTHTTLRWRGWTLQEEVLSHREIICKRPAVMWKCQRYSRTETGHEFPTGPLASIWGQKPGQGPRELWLEWMMDYSGRIFTYERDTFSALVGIVHTYSERTGYTHILGSWRETMIQDLLWVRGEPSPVVAPSKVMPLVPSWSWLTRTRKIAFGWDYDELQPGESYDMVRIRHEATVVEAGVDWAGEPLLSDIVATRLVIEGRARQMRLRMDLRCADSDIPGLKVGDEEPEITDSNPSPWQCAGHFDQDGENDGVYTCLLMRSTSKAVDDLPEYISDAFLILVPDETQGPDAFRRVGAASMRAGRGLFNWDDVPTRTIRLV